MCYDTIKVSEARGVVTLTLNRPEVHNAMNDVMMKELSSVFKGVSKREDVRAVVLTGEGRSFCAGADLEWMRAMAGYSMEENIEDSRLLLDLYDSIYTCPKVVIGRINGHAFGGGLGLIAVCDITIGVEGKKFAFSEVNLGIIPSVISSYVVRRIGLGHMRHLFITGERFDTQRAREIGLIDYVVSEDDLDRRVEEQLELVRTSGPRAVAEVKDLCDLWLNMDIEEYKRYTVEKIAELRVSEEGQEGIKAFLEKRRPKWCE